MKKLSMLTGVASVLTLLFAVIEVPMKVHLLRVHPLSLIILAGVLAQIAVTMMVYDRVYGEKSAKP